MGQNLKPLLNMKNYLYCGFYLSFLKNNFCNEIVLYNKRE